MSVAKDCCDPFVADILFSCITVEEGPKVNHAEFFGMAPGTVKIGKAYRDEKGEWVVPLEYRAEGWGKEEQGTNDS